MVTKLPMDGEQGQCRDMVHIPDGTEQDLRDFITLFRMVHNLKLMNWFFSGILYLIFLGHG